MQAVLSNLQVQVRKCYASQRLEDVTDDNVDFKQKTQKTYSIPQWFAYHTRDDFDLRTHFSYLFFSLFTKTKTESVS